MIYHITTAEHYHSFAGKDYYESPALHEEGFIHCSTEDQVSGILQRYFDGQSNLFLLVIDAAKLKSRLKIEAASNGELFPHVYGPVNKSAIVSIETIGEE